MNNRIEAKFLMEKFFPDWRTYPKNSLIPEVVMGSDEEDTVVCFLVLAENDIDEELSQEFDALEFDIYTEPNSNGEDTDMIIALTKNNYIKGDIALKAVIYGDDKESQKSFGRMVKSVNEFYLFTSNNEGKASSVKEFGFNNMDLPILDKLLSELLSE
jgi:hypothetical protein